MLKIVSLLILVSIYLNLACHNVHKTLAIISQCHLSVSNYFSCVIYIKTCFFRAKQCYSRVVFPLAVQFQLGWIFWRWPAFVIIELMHKNSLLLNQHNGDDAPQNSKSQLEMLLPSSWSSLNMAAASFSAVSVSILQRARCHNFESHSSNAQGLKNPRTYVTYGSSTQSSMSHDIALYTYRFLYSGFEHLFHIARFTLSAYSQLRIATGGTYATQS